MKGKTITQKEIETGYYEHGLIRLQIIVVDGRLEQISFVEQIPLGQTCSSSVQLVINQLDEYFEGRRKKFDLSYKLSGTAFQQAVWRQIAAIPYGKTVSYQQIAERIGNPKACRAVGAATGRNKLPIVIPCHRVVGARGELTGFGGGLGVKEYLLELEGIRDF